MIHNSYHEIRKSIGSHEQESVTNIQQRIAKELTDRLGIKNTSGIVYKKLSVELSALIAKQEVLTSAIVTMLYHKDQSIASIMSNRDFEESHPIRASVAKSTTQASDNSSITTPSLALVPSLANFISDNALIQEYEGILARLVRMTSELENLAQQMHQEEQKLIQTAQLEANVVMAIETLCEAISSAFTNDEETLSTKLALTPESASKVDDEFSTLQNSYQHFDTLTKNYETLLKNLEQLQPKLQSALHADFQPREAHARQAASLINALESHFTLFQSNRPSPAPVRTAQAKEDLYDLPLIPSAGSSLN